MFEVVLSHQWMNPFIATFTISVIPILSLVFVPLLNSKQSGLPLNFMMCFAAGSLLTDALDHLTEEAATRDPQTVTMQTLLGIVLFFAIDKITRFVHDHDSSSHSAGYLSLIADAVHNFTDGLAIAASFGKNMRSGLATTAAIFMHEIPHELGDYALLSKSGYNHAEIIQLQFLTAGAAFAGTGVGVAIENGWMNIGKDSQWLLPLTCGGFLYLSLCTILSEVVQNDKRNKSFLECIKDILAVLGGIAVLHFLETII